MPSEEQPESESAEPAPPAKPADERGAIARRAGLVALGTLASRVLGLVRDAVIAATFARVATDAFWYAFTIPNALRVLLGEGAVSGAFVPVLTDVREKRGPAEAHVFFRRLAGVFALVLFAVSLVGVFAAPALVHLYASGLGDDPEAFRTTEALVRIVFPYIALMGLAALATGALHAHKRFLAPAFAPVWLNVCLIGAALALPTVVERWGLPGVAALAIGALAGGSLQLAFQLPALRRIGYLRLPRPRLDADVRRAFGLLAPLLAGLGVYQLNIILSRNLASYLPEGSMSYLSYGQRLVEIPQGMFALAIGTAALPTLAELQSRGDLEEAKRIFRYGLRLTLFVAVPSTVALAILAEPAIAAVFGRGRFADPVAISETARSLVFMAAGIWAVASVRTIVPMFHALGDTRTPVLASATNLVVFGVVGGTLMGPMQHAGLAAGVIAAAVAQLLALLALLRRKVGRLGLSEVLASAWRVLLASAAMGGVLWPIVQLGEWGEGGTGKNTALFAAAVVAGGLTYLVVAAVAGSPELRQLLRTLRRKLRKS